jgi:hypothetical protein
MKPVDGLMRADYTNLMIETHQIAEIGNDVAMLVSTST